MASAACKHEERSVLELPAERHQDRLCMEFGHGEILFFLLILPQFYLVLMAHLPFVRYAPSLPQSGSRLWVTWTLI